MVLIGRSRRPKLKGLSRNPTPVFQKRFNPLLPTPHDYPFRLSVRRSLSFCPSLFPRQSWSFCPETVLGSLNRYTRPSSLLNDPFCPCSHGSHHWAHLVYPLVLYGRGLGDPRTVTYSLDFNTVSLCWTPLKIPTTGLLYFRDLIIIIDLLSPLRHKERVDTYDL